MCWVGTRTLSMVVLEESRVAGSNLAGGECGAGDHKLWVITGDKLLHGALLN